MLAATHSLDGTLRRISVNLRRQEIARKIAAVAGYNMACTMAAGLSGIIIARLLGPTVRGEYAAITAWYSIAFVVGGMGQSAAICFYVAQKPRRAPTYLATSRTMMLGTSALITTIGILLAPVLAHGNHEVARGYDVGFVASILAIVGACYICSLQARDLHEWNRVRLIQPTLYLIMVLSLWRFHLLSLERILEMMTAALLLQFLWAYMMCRKTRLAPGCLDPRLLRPLAGYGIAQIAAITPSTINLQLDQLILSQTVAAADLGRYAVAVSLSLLPIPIVSAIGNVAFPWLAAQRTVTNVTIKLQRLAVISSLGISASILVPFGLLAYWIVPEVLGRQYQSSVPLLWILTPGAIFISCSQVVGDLLRGRKQPIIVAKAQGVAAIFTVALLIALLPFIGVYGAAVASTVAYGVALAVMLRHMWRLPIN